MDRRAFVGATVMAGLSAVCPLYRAPMARAASIASWDFSANAGLSDNAIVERFESIVSTYEVGVPLSDEDADFVLRYALPTPIGFHAVQVNAAAAEEGLFVFPIPGREVAHEGGPPRGLPSAVRARRGTQREARATRVAAALGTRTWAGEGSALLLRGLPSYPAPRPPLPSTRSSRAARGGSGC